MMVVALISVVTVFSLWEHRKGQWQYPNLEYSDHQRSLVVCPWVRF